MTACLLAGIAVLAAVTVACIPSAYHLIRYGTERTPR